MFKLVLNETGLIITLVGNQLLEHYLGGYVNLGEINVYKEMYYLNETDNIHEFPEEDYFCKIEESNFYLLHLLNENILSDCLNDLLNTIDFLDTNSQQYFLKYMMNYDFRTAFCLSVNDNNSIRLLFRVLESLQNEIIFNLQDFDVYLEHFRKDSNNKNIVNFIISYRDYYYSKEEIDAYYDRKDKVLKGIELPTEREILRDWVFTRYGDEINLIGYKGTAPKVKIPNMLENGAKIVKIDGKDVNTELDKYLIINASVIYSQSIMHFDNDIEVFYLDSSFFAQFEYISGNADCHIIQIHGADAKPFDFSLDVFEEPNGYPYPIDKRKKY